MENLTTYLESSTIHGLAHIATGRKYVKLLWILVVIGGFTGAGVMIYKSFKSWDETPVKTTIETQPITEITFPKVTVCPPKNTYTDLNYDLMMTENMTLDNDTRNEMTNYAVEMLYDYLYDIVVNNVFQLEETDRYYNWYRGYSEIKIPYISDSGGGNTLQPMTTVTNGSFYTRQFGDPFDADSVERWFTYHPMIYPPSSVQQNPNVTLHFKVEKVLLKHLSSGYDKFTGKYTSYNFTPPSNNHQFKHTRKVLMADLKKQRLTQMPGFRISWYYSGMEVKSWPRFENKSASKALVRN